MDPRLFRRNIFNNNHFFLDQVEAPPELRLFQSCKCFLVLESKG